MSSTISNTVSGILPEGAQDYLYSAVNAVLLVLLAFGVVGHDDAALWTQLSIAGVTLLYAVAYSPSTWRTALYAVTGPLGALLMAYGVVADQQWALLTAAIGQFLGVTTAAVASGRPHPKHAKTALVGQVRVISQRA